MSLASDDHEAQQEQFHRWLDQEEQLDEYLRSNRPEQEPPEEWTEFDDLNERVLRGEYDDVIHPVDDPDSYRSCENCGLELIATETNPTGWVLDGGLAPYITPTSTCTDHC